MKFAADSFKQAFKSRYMNYMKLPVVNYSISYPFHVIGFRKYQGMSVCFIKVVVWSQVKIFNLALGGFKALALTN